MMHKRIQRSLQDFFLIAVASLACSPGALTTVRPTADTAKDREVKVVGSPLPSSKENEKALEPSSPWLEARLSEKSLYVHGNYPKKYDIGIGKPNHPTPIGEYTLGAIVKNPSWCPTRRYTWISDDAWEYLQEHGCMHADNPRNPLRAYWITFSRGYGIHGTNNPQSIGKEESHGCLRMRDADIIDLVSRVRTGTRLVIRD